MSNYIYALVLFTTKGNPFVPLTYKVFNNLFVESFNGPFLKYEPSIYIDFESSLFYAFVHRVGSPSSDRTYVVIYCLTRSFNV